MDLPFLKDFNVPGRQRNFQFPAFGNFLQVKIHFPLPTNGMTASGAKQAWRGSRFVDGRNAPNSQK
jgi:hypothetical protein